MNNIRFLESILTELCEWARLVDRVLPEILRVEISYSLNFLRDKLKDYEFWPVQSRHYGRLGDDAILLLYFHPFPTVYKLVLSLSLLVLMSKEIAWDRRFVHIIISTLLGHNTIKNYTWSNSTPGIGNKENIQNRDVREELVVSKSLSELD